MVSQLAPVRRPTLSGEVADRLAEAIRSGELVPGDRLPAERELGVQFGVGRTSVREALRMLQAKGMVTVRPGDGVFVADCPTPAQQPMTRWDSQDQFRVDDLFEARLAIEPLVRRASRPGIAPSSGPLPPAMPRRRSGRCAITRGDSSLSWKQAHRLGPLVNPIDRAHMQMDRHEAVVRPGAVHGGADAIISRYEVTILCRFPPKHGADRRGLGAGAIRVDRDPANRPGAVVDGVAPSRLALGRRFSSPEGGTEKSWTTTN
jgi:DNA-binding transcriptional regulator YhcF (GntR family)